MLLDVVVELSKGFDCRELCLRDEHTILGLYDTDEVYETQAVEFKCLVDGSIGSDCSLIDFKLFCQFGIDLSNDFFYCNFLLIWLLFIDNVSYTFFTMMVELVPPKPKLLERNMSKCVSFVSGRTLMQAVSSSGFSKLMLPAIKPFFIIKVE